MSETVIEVRGLGKRYRIGARQQAHSTLRDAITATAASVWKRTGGLLGGAAPGQGTETFWALKDVSFDVKRGEVLGIIGRNGAGKSTLLKILTRITEPTEGTASLRGRVRSLLEVGTGFHPELTGRENVYLSGAVLGMKKAEIDARFDEIVAFAEVEKFLDTPVKRYSSGMYVRLGFAVAAHLEPDILLIDEVLAVGDASFQKKCLGKMGHVARSGRTILFVSHNMAAIQHNCQRCVLISDGKLVVDDSSEVAIEEYLHVRRRLADDKLAYHVDREQIDRSGSKEFRITGLSLHEPSGGDLLHCGTGDPVSLRIEYEAESRFVSPAFVFILKNHWGQELLLLNTTPISGYRIEKLGVRGRVDLTIRSLPLTAGHYFLDVGFVKESREWVVRLDEVIELEISPKDVYGSGMTQKNARGVLVVPHEWDHQVEEEA
jgi:homopolymeric O-antigen transport system ATP-binding protein